MHSNKNSAYKSECMIVYRVCMCWRASDPLTKHDEQKKKFCANFQSIKSKVRNE